MRLSGWQRLGVIATGIYFIVGVFYWQHQEFSASMREARAPYNDCIKENGTAKVQKDCNEVWGQAYLSETAGDWSNALWLTILPIPLFWIFGLGSGAAVRWVRRGFATS